MLKSKTDKVYEYILTRISSGDYPSGSFLREEDIAAANGVSRTVVRQALQRLHAARLVNLIPNTGAQVIRPSIEDARDYMDTRIALEGMAAGLFAERADATDIAVLERLVDELERNYEDNPAEVSRLDAEFHDFIISHCGNRVIERIMLNTRLQFIEWSIISQLREREQKIKPSDTHRQILDAIRTRDRQTARQAMERHISRNRSL